MSEFMVDCDTHGSARAAFVCQHTLQSLQDAKARGFISVRDPNGCINAYCHECDAVLQSHGGNWNDESEAFASITLVCEGCATKVATLNGMTELPQ
jgi:hypothetical protein